MMLEELLKSLGAPDVLIAQMDAQALSQGYGVWGVSAESLAWLGMQLWKYFPPESRQALLNAIFGAADRAVRVYAAEALERAGMVHEAAMLHTLSPVVDEKTAEAAESAAWDVLQAARATQATRAAESAHAAREAVWAAWAAPDAAELDAARVATVVPRVVNAAAQAARMVGRSAEEVAQSFTDFRAALPLGILKAAITKTITARLACETPEA